MSLQQGTVIADRYRLMRLIATGGMGQVWEAMDTRLNRRVAVKVLKSEYSNDPEFIGRFRTEAQTTARLNNPGIAGVFVAPSKGVSTDLSVAMVSAAFVAATGYVTRAERGPQPSSLVFVGAGSNIAGYVPNIPGFEYNINKVMLLASTEVGQDALIRFYVLHVALLPLVTGTLIGVHFWRIRKDGGLSRPPENFRPDPYRVVQRSDTKESFAPGVRRTYGLMELVRGTCPTVDKGPYNFVFTWPHLLRAELLAFMVTLIFCLALSLIDAPLEEPANASNPPNPSKAPWYFLGLQEMVAYNAFWGGVAIPGLIVLGLASIPYLDRNPHGTGVWFHRSRYFAIFVYTAFMTLQAILIIVGTY